MLAVQVQTPTFFFERAIDQLVERFPEDAVDRLRANLKAFRAWVAEPAFRAESPESAVDHVLKSYGPSVQLKAEFIAVLASVPHGFELFNQAVTEELVDSVPVGGPAALNEAIDHLQRALRTWVRFIAFHPDVEAVVDLDRLTEAFNLGFHADNLLTVCSMASDSESGPIKQPLLKALCAAAATFAERYHAAIRDMVEQVAPKLDESHPFKPSSLADLLSLPPYDGPAATVEEMDDAVGSLFGPP